MPVRTTYIKSEERLDLSFSGNLDISLSRDIFGVCRRVSPNLATCIIDLSDVVRIFDSGVALVQVLYRQLEAAGAIVVFLSDRPEVREKIAVITCKKFYPAAA